MNDDLENAHTTYSFTLAYAALLLSLLTTLSLKYGLSFIEVNLQTDVCFLISFGIFFGITRFSMIILDEETDIIIKKLCYHFDLTPKDMREAIYFGLLCEKNFEKWTKPGVLAWLIEKRNANDKRNAYLVFREISTYDLSSFIAENENKKRSP